MFGEKNISSQTWDTYYILSMQISVIIQIYNVKLATGIIFARFTMIINLLSYIQLLLLVACHLPSSSQLYMEL